MKYLLFVFAKHKKNQDQFVKMMAQEISNVLDNENIGYYFGPESIIYSFTATENIKDLEYFLKIYLGAIGIVYFMVPFEPDKMSYWIEPEIEDMLLNPDKNTMQESLEDIIDVEAFKLFFNNIDDYEMNFKINSNENEFSLDELLDKISQNGYESLTTNEKKILDKYSKN